MAKYSYPGASRTQNFEKAFSSDVMDTDVAVLHSTEGINWPGYGGGASAPNYTFFASIKERRGYWREHFAANLSSRALENRPGGVQTNTLNAVQVELIGTCDSRYAKRWGSLTAGVDYIYWPDAPQWALDELAKFFKWLAGVCPRFKIIDGAPRGWVKYPDSYGLGARQRLTFTEWNRSVGILGHQHVPENVHGDPGDLDVNALVAAASGVTVPTKPPVTPAPVIKDQMDPAQYFLGAKGDHVTWLGKRLVIWSKALGLAAPYKVGPGPSFTETDRRAVAAFQQAQGWTGKDADGFPGAQSLAILASDPKSKPKPSTKPKPVTITSAVANLAGSNAHGRATGLARARRYVAAREATPVDVIDAQEATVVSLVRPTLDLGLKPLGYKRTKGGEGRYQWANLGQVNVIASGLLTVPSKLWYKRDDKQAAWVIVEKSGIRAMDVSWHLESDLGDVPDGLRVDQALWIATQSLGIAAMHATKSQNVMLAGDTNSEGMVLDALIDADWRNVAAGTEFEDDYTFMGWDGEARERFDYGLVREDAAPAELVAVAHDTTISDHAGLRIVRQLTI